LGSPRPASAPTQPASQVSIASSPLCPGRRLQHRLGLDLGRKHLDDFQAVGAEPAPVAHELAQIREANPNKMSLDQHGVVDADEVALAFGDRFQAVSTGQPDLSAHHAVAPVFNEAEVVPIDQVEEAQPARVGLELGS
jgi:hypothetical protein